MIGWSDLLVRLRALLRGDREERELDEELRFHLEREVEERVRRGADPVQARREAILVLGGVESTKEEVREARGVGPLQDLMGDVRYAVRALRRSPGFTAAAVLVLGLGLGAATAVYAVADAVLFAKLPYPDPDRLVRIYEKNSPTNLWNLSTVDVEAIAADQRSLAAFGAVSRTGMALSGLGGAPEQIMVGRATSGFFQALGVTPVAGRVVAPSDDRSDAPRVAVLSHDLARRLGPTPRAAIGRSVTLDGVSHVVVGVLPPGVDRLAGFRADAWTGLELRPPTRRGPFWTQGIARLAPGVTLAAARADLDRISRTIFPVWQSSFQDAEARLTPVPLLDAIVGGAPRQVELFGGAVALLLLIAVANVATLMLVRASARESELALRAAVGAGRLRLARLVLVECLVLAAAAGLVGLAFARLGIGLAPVVAPALPRIEGAALGGSTLLFAVGAWLAAGILVAVSPVSAVLAGLAGVPRAGDLRRSGASRRSQAIRGAFVVAEFALALPLLVGAGLLLRTFLGLQRVDPGVDPTGVVGVAVALPASRYPGYDEVQAFWRRTVERIGAAPGVVSAGIATTLPPDDQGNSTNNFDLRDKPVPEGAAQPTAPWAAVTDGYFAALAIPLVEGRLFTPADSGAARPVAVVSRAWADRYFPGERVLGRELFEGGCRTCPPTTVVGVVGDVKYLGLGGEGDAVYVPLTQYPARQAYLVVRGGDVGATTRVVRDRLAGLDPELAGTETVLADRLEASLADPLRRTGVVAAFASLALFLAAVGIFGLMSYAVRRERREIGVRIALGADPAAVRWMVVRRGMRYAAGGTAIGLALSLLVARWLGTLLYGVAPTDPGTLVGVVVVLGATALLACWLPGLRAARIRPLEAIASE